ncbi:CDP-alcohol phosphatidyltransferase family protein [Microbacterium sp. As-52]|uniref:CDP-alcohol phosphatidyltransferase family protein n=1 Tax=Microbacterium sp. As-52 TaxID=3390503 RepID=UPI003CF2C140
MDILEWVRTTASALPDPLVWALGGLFAFLENGLGLGFFLPGETIVVFLSASLSDVWAVVVMFLVVVVAGSAGDHVGYLLGRHFGVGMRDLRLVKRLGIDRWDRAVEILHRRGAIAVFLTRLVPVVRTLTPAAAGVAKVRYPSFLLASLAGAATWAAIYVSVGFLLRASLDAVTKALGPISNVLLLVVVAGGVVFFAVRFIRTRSLARAVDATDDAAPIQPTVVDRLFREDEWRTWPNLITGIRLLLLPVFLWLITARMLWAALVVIGLVFLTDWLDGWLARRTNSVSALGTWLDPVADRITVVVTAVAFTLGHLIPWETLVLLLIPDVLLGSAALLFFRGNPAVPVTMVGKVRTALIFVGLLGVLLGSALSESGLVSLSWIVGMSFLLFLIGIVGHYIAASQYARAMITQKLSVREG